MKPLVDQPTAAPTVQGEVWSVLAQAADRCQALHCEAPEEEATATAMVTNALSALAAVIARGDVVALEELRHWTNRQTSKDLPPPTINGGNAWLRASSDRIKLVPELAELARTLAADMARWAHAEGLCPFKRRVKQAIPYLVIADMNFVGFVPNDAISVERIDFRARAGAKPRIAWGMTPRLMIAQELAARLQPHFPEKRTLTVQQLALEIYAQMPLYGSARSTDTKHMHMADVFAEDHEQTIRAAFRAVGLEPTAVKNLFAADAMRAYREGKVPRRRGRPRSSSTP